VRLGEIERLKREEPRRASGQRRTIQVSRVKA